MQRMLRKRTAWLWGTVAFVLSLLICGCGTLLNVLIGVGGGVGAEPPLWAKILLVLPIRPFRFESYLVYVANSLVWSLIAASITVVAMHLLHATQHFLRRRRAQP